jgi:hypothetical protein
MRKIVLAYALLAAFFFARNNVLHGVSGSSRSYAGLADAAEDKVLFNLKTHIFHGPGCSAGKACTVNCVTMARSEAVKRGRPCGRCGGL